jgi:hypothetical protein
MGGDFLPVIVMIVGLILNLTGAILISLAAFGIGEFINNINEQKDSGFQTAKVSYTATINTFFIFMLVNFTCCLFIVLFTRLPVEIVVLLFPFGFFAWKLSVIVLGITSSLIRRIAPPHKPGRNILVLLLSLFVALGWALLYGFAEILHIAAQFLDLPIRYIAEKIIGRFIFRLFISVDATMRKGHRTGLKVTSLLGAVFLIMGFLYQIVGLITSIT